jgi:hypothetical protein
MLGSIHDIINMDMDDYNRIGIRIEKDFSSKVLEKLEIGKIYRALICVKYEEIGISKGSTPMKSIMITRSISSKLILDRIQRELRRFENEYNLEDYSGHCFVGWKEWLSNDEYAAGVSNKKVDERITEVLQDEVKSRNNLTKISKNMIEGEAFEMINKLSPLFNSVVGGKMYKKLS